MTKTILLAAASLIVAAGPALADPIEGNWKTEKGTTAQIAQCGKAYCITLKSGEHAGRKIGTFEPSGGGKYTGKVTDPANDKTYNGKGSLSGNAFTMKGCVLGGLICRGETWKRM